MAAKRNAQRSKVRPKRRTPKRRGPAKMKAYASFDLYLADQLPANQPLLLALRAFVRRTAPQLIEAVKWGNGCWLHDGGPVAYLYSAPDYVQFGFLLGSKLADPLRLLAGDGAYVRHVKVRQLADIDERAFAALLAQAIALGPPVRKKAAAGAPRREPAAPPARRAKRRSRR
jgi:hypothetical protein